MGYTLEIVAGTQGSQATGSNANYEVLFDENVQDGVLIGTISNLDPSVTNITWRTFAGSSNHNYTITKNTGTGLWEIRVKAGSGGAAADNFNYEQSTDRTQGIYIDAFDANGNKVGEGDFTVTMRNVNEAPTNITLTGGANGDASFNENAALDTVVGVLGAADPDLTGKTFTYKFKNAPGDGLTSADGLFKIALNPGTNKWEVQVAKAGIDYDSLAAAAKHYAETIVVTDSGTPTQSYEKAFNIVIKDDPTDNAPANKAPTTPTGATQINEGTAANTPVLTLDDRDDDNQVIIYTFQNALAGSNGLISGDGRFKIVGNVIQVNNPADVATDETVTYAVVANDGSGAANATVTGNVTITVKNVASTGSYTLEIVAGTQGSQATGSNANYEVLFDENVEDDVLIGTIAKLDPAATRVEWRTFVGSSNALYSITKNTTSGLWEIRVKAGSGGAAADNFNYEQSTDRTQGIYIDAFDANGNKVGEGDFTVTMRNVNEAPTNITLTGGANGDASFNENAALDTVVGVLGAADPDLTGKTFTYKFKNAPGDGLTSADGLFKIALNPGTNKWEVQVAKAGIDYDSLPAAAKHYAETIVVTDSGTPAQSYEKAFNIVIKDDPTDNAPANKAPTTPTGTTQINEGTAANTPVVTLDDRDDDNQVITYTFQNALAGSNGLISGDGRFKIVGNVIQVNNPADVATDETVTYAVVANDGSGAANATVTGNVTITVKNVAAVNKAPTTPSGTVAIDETKGANELVLALDDRDDDGQIITYTFQNAQANSGGLISADGRFKIVGNTIVVNALTDVGADTPYTYAVVANDGSGAANATATGNVTITVNNVNKAPTTPSGTAAIPETTADNVDVLTLGPATDADGQTITYTFQGGALISGDGRFKIVGNKIQVASQAALEVGANSPFTYAVVSNDGSGAANATATGNVTITVNNVNKAPTTPSGTAQINETTADNVDVLTLGPATDADGQTITYTFQGGALISGDGRFKIVGNKIQVASQAALEVGANSPFTYAVVADDSSGAANATATGNITITVNNVNKAPTAPSGTAQVNEGSAADTPVMTLDDRDDDNQVISYTFQNALVGSNGLISGDGRFKIVGNTIVVNTPADVAADDVVTYAIVANDGSGAANATVTGNVTITVKNVAAVNNAPTTPTGTAQVNEGTAPSTNVLVLDDRDDDGQIITYTFQNALAGSGGLVSADGRFKIVGNVIQVNNPANVAADDAVAYAIVANDGSGAANATVTGNVTITVKNVAPANTAPTGLTLSNSFINEYDAVNNAVIGTLSASDPGDALKYSLVDNAGGLFRVDEGSGQLFVVGGLNFEAAASHKILVRATDTAGHSIDQVFTINVGDQLTLNKRGTKKNDKLNGSMLDDILKGGSGNGADQLKGLAGDDQLLGESGNDKLYGGDGIDVLKGGKGNDQLRGEAGDDRLYGEDGNDLLYGGAGKDTFVFATKLNKARNLDTIKDFNVADDTIWLDNKIFKKLGAAGSEAAPAALAKDFFVIGKKAKDKNDYLVYDNKKGVLYYDIDGSGKKAAVEIAKINKKLALDFNDFFVV